MFLDAKKNRNIIFIWTKQYKCKYKKQHSPIFSAYEINKNPG